MDSSDRGLTSEIRDEDPPSIQKSPTSLPNSLPPLLTTPGPLIRQSPGPRFETRREKKDGSRVPGSPTVHVPSRRSLRTTCLGPLIGSGSFGPQGRHQPVLPSDGSGCWWGPPLVRTLVVLLNPRLSQLCTTRGVGGRGWIPVPRTTLWVVCRVTLRPVIGRDLSVSTPV